MDMQQLKLSRSESVFVVPVTGRVRRATVALSDKPTASGSRCTTARLSGPRFHPKA
jgi:hypothetical protein